MRIKFISLVNGSAFVLNKNLLSIIAEGISKFSDFEIVDTAPDIVHICSKWSSMVASSIKYFTNKGVPVVFSSANGLVEQLSPQSSTLSPTVFHCCGPAEARLINTNLPKANVVVISNAEFTSTTNVETMLNQFKDLYTKTFYDHDSSIKAMIMEKVKQSNVNDDTIFNICSRLLYLNYAFKRGTIRQNMLDSISDELINSNYDEEIMRRTLNELKLMPFAASVMALLKEVSHLTEGFMPVAASTDKIMKHMKKLII